MKNNDFTQQVLQLLAPVSLGRPFFFCPSLDSTNTELKKRAQDGAPHGACIAADFQSAGRGRLQRSWQAGAGSSLLFSVLLRPPAKLNRMFAFSALASLSVCHALENHGLKPQIKWPNDIYLHDVKLSGMLSEASGDPLFLIIGIGININQNKDELRQLDQPAISLKAATGREWNRPRLLAEILGHLDRLYNEWQHGGDMWLPAYCARSWLLNKQVVVESGERKLKGKAVAINPDGSLVLKRGEETININYGDVSILAVNGRWKDDK